MNYFKSKYIKAGVLALALSVTGTSCSDYLTEVNPNEPNTESYFQNLDQSQATLTAVYSNFMNHYSTSIMEDACRADTGYPSAGRPAPTNSLVDWYNQTYNNVTQSLRFRWAGLYEGIFRANQLIEGLELKLTDLKDTEEWKLQMAQAKFFRGLFHFYAYQTFNNGKVIMRDKVPVSDEEFNKSVSPAADVLAFVREDLEYAYENLPYVYEGEYANQGRVSKGAAATILGNSYLFEGDYSKAKEYFEDILVTNKASYGYELVDDMDLLFTTAGEFNKESILEINYSLDVRQDLNEWDEMNGTNRLAFTGPNKFGGINRMLPVAWISYAYKTEPMANSERNYARDENGEVLMNDETPVMRNVPLRASAMIALIEDEQTPYYGFPSVYEANPVRSTEFAFYKKYTNHDRLGHEAELPYGMRRSPKNVVVNRLAEVVLNYAECLIQEGNLGGAIDQINLIRKRWALQLLGETADGELGEDFNGKTREAYTQEDLMNHLMYVEKPLELAGEGHSIRWIDMRRWGIIEDRFKTLSQEFYHIGAYKERNGSILPGTNPSDSRINGGFADYELAAENYKEAYHAYLPIPAMEETTNPNLYAN